MNFTEKTIALLGNPNVGKSTLFNAVTGMNQHTGNWPGKTVISASGTYTFKNETYTLVDLPGIYSLSAHSAEEEVSRDFLCFENVHVAVVVCDATSLERNLNLVLQTLSITENVIVCVNLMDEAKKRGIFIDLKLLSKTLGVPVCAVTARNKKGINELLSKIAYTCKYAPQNTIRPFFSRDIEDAITYISKNLPNCPINKRFLATKILEKDTDFIKIIAKNCPGLILDKEKLSRKVSDIRIKLLSKGVPFESIKEEIICTPVKLAESIAKKCVSSSNKPNPDRKIDRILTGKLTGIPIMLLILCFVFWLTISGANVPSDILSKSLFWFQDRLSEFMFWLGSPAWLEGILIQGVYKTLAWVVAVMLPPMAIFFPLFTLLEDFGYLPRVAFNLDHSFQKAGACGKQALTTCMGFGCNAAGVVGCRIIDSPRERLIAMITNNFVPCNGRFPTLIAIITIFFTGMVSIPFLQDLSCALILLCIIILGMFMTFLVSRILSSTILKGIPSSFTLELPPYRKPQIGKVIVRSIFDRTLFVLGRAVIVAAPAGLILWLLANININDISVLNHLSAFLDPFAKTFGLDGVILIAFILSFPANEITLPIILMIYLSKGSLIDYENLSQLGDLLIKNGWTWLTAVCTILFCLMHWPCSTTCLTIKKESGSLKWTVLSFIIPTIAGLTCCFLVTSVSKLFGLV